MNISQFLLGPYVNSHNSLRLFYTWSLAFIYPLPFGALKLSLPFKKISETEAWHKWNRIVCGLLCKAFFTKHVDIHSCLCMCRAVHALSLVSTVASRGYITAGLFIQAFPRLITLAKSMNHRATGPLGTEEGSSRPYFSNSTPAVLISNACYTAHKVAQPLVAYLQLQATHSLRTKCLLNLPSLAC